MATCTEVTLDAAPTTPDITFRTAVALQAYSASSMLLIEPGENNVEIVHQKDFYFSFNRKSRRFSCSQNNINFSVVHLCYLFCLKGQNLKTSTVLSRLIESEPLSFLLGQLFLKFRYYRLKKSFIVFKVKVTDRQM